MKLAEHVPDMLRYRRHAESADLVHFMWLPVPGIDRRLHDSVDLYQRGKLDGFSSKSPDTVNAQTQTRF